MRHGIAGNKLGRNSSWRKATVRDIATATLTRERICTTKAKAKEARKLVDRLVTMGKKGSLAHKRRAYAVLCNHRLVSELFESIAPRFQLRAGGYTRIIPLGMRRGDNAQLVYLELTEKKPVAVKPAKVAKAKSVKSAKPAVEDAVITATETAAADETKNKSAKPKTKSAARPKARAADPDAPAKGKTDKKIVGGIKKIFRRKAGD